MTATATARRQLYDELVDVLPGDVLALEQYRPPELATPVAYLDVAGRRFDVADGAPVVVATIPVVVIVDGADDAQMAALDDWGDLVWRAVIAAGGTPVGATPAQVDVDGPVLRALVTTAEFEIEHLTLCEE